MNGFDRQQFIGDFIRWLGQPFVNVFPVSRERADAIADKYFRSVKAITDDLVKDVVRVMRDSVTTNEDHGRIREWKRCCRGVADYLLRPGDIDSNHRLVAAGVVIRLSGYKHHCPPFFAAFQPAAFQIAAKIWGPCVLQYEKTGGDITLDPGCVDEDGYITVWDLAKGSPVEVTRSEAEIRTLASRILNFICEREYANARIRRRDYNFIEDEFRKDERVLGR